MTHLRKRGWTTRLTPLGSSSRTRRNALRPTDRSCFTRLPSDDLTTSRLQSLSLRGEIRCARVGAGRQRLRRSGKLNEIRKYKVVERAGRTHRSRISCGARFNQCPRGASERPSQKVKSAETGQPRREWRSAAPRRDRSGHKDSFPISLVFSEDAGH